ncbi:hypothetical protein [Enterovibrio baiacu]|uniref:hypothetical protein n=1 Tax=Enterovibrio baiacu TaxID=2491023 RepID=UPI003D152D01
MNKSIVFLVVISQSLLVAGAAYKTSLRSQLQHQIDASTELPPKGAVNIYDLLLYR